MQRTPLIAGNWKMHGSLAQVEKLLTNIPAFVQDFKNIQIVILPSLVHIHFAKKLLTSTPIKYGAQNFYIGKEGAFTGEVSGPMLKDLGCNYVLVGHSERRAIFKEDLSLIADKFKAAQTADLTPILCLGETQTEREQGMTEAIVGAQLQSVIDAAGIDALQNAVVAYEPVWAIGTGLTATPDQAQAVHAFIRDKIKQINVDIAQTIRILYGGSMKAENAVELLAMPDIDGGLIGGASLKADSFAAICKAAMDSLSTEHTQF